MKARRRLWNWLKVVVSLSALAWVLAHIPLSDVLGAVRDADPWPLVLAFGLFNLSLVVRAGRWLILLRGLGARVPFGRLVKLYFVGSFFNAFLPSGFGGDVVRAAEVMQQVEPGAAVGTVIVDRLSGLMMLFVMALLALPVTGRMLPGGTVITVAAVSGAGLVGGLVLLQGGLLRWLGPLLERLLPARWAAALSPTANGLVGQVHASVTGCGVRALLGAFAASALFNAMLVGWWLLIGQALGVTVKPLTYVTFVPVFSLALMVPSIGGLGVREGLAPLLFQGVGVAQATAVAMSLVDFALNRGTGLVGGLVYLVTGLQDLGESDDG